MSSSSALRVVHVFRAPLGGLFRHVIDLAVEQASRGCQVGLFFDAGGDGPRVRDAIARIPEARRLRIATTPIRRNPHPFDLAVLRSFACYLNEIRPDVVHGHGSKGGFYARLSGSVPGRPRPIRAYTPHGGSFNYAPGSLLHAAYMAVERAMARRTDLFLFESDHIRLKCEAYVGARFGLSRVIVNGLGPKEFEPAIPAEDASDVLYVGELRAAKGVDTLLEALALIAHDTAKPPSATLVGSGPDRDALAARAAALGLGGFVRFPGPMPVRQAFALGRLMVAPSRAESMPYIVLETAAAQAPLLTTEVGGIPEIFGPFRNRLAPPDDPVDLARRIRLELGRPAEERQARARELADYVRGRFSLDNMAEAVLAAYGEALARRDAGLARRTTDSPAQRVKEA